MLLNIDNGRIILFRLVMFSRICRHIAAISYNIWTGQLFLFDMELLSKLISCINNVILINCDVIVFHIIPHKCYWVLIECYAGEFHCITVVLFFCIYFLYVRGECVLTILIWYNTCICK
ncbi:hypothetical protein KUTeg_024415 [Tegillarca granosa]|uniref:Uncharacterized protein n=1 Tax=Tegillarca granosa TaxID=220873 RepID=A0ABQ9E1B4_TEGGR|nr:hypothetical protein KUTeg_024415 [Tegillarca granosa]